MAALAVAAALLVPGTAHAAVDLGPVLGALPASGEGGGPADPSYNQPVAGACTAGVPLSDPAWFRLPSGTTGSVFARARIQVSSTARFQTIASTRVALVDVTDPAAPAVLSCDGGPAAIPTGRAVAAVVWVDDPAEWGTVQSACAETFACPQPTEVFVDRGTSPPGNDDVANATVVTSLPYSTTGSTALATDDGPDGFSSCSTIAGSDAPVSTAWWRWTASSDGYLTATATGTWSPCSAIVDADPAVAPPQWWYDADGLARPQFPVVAGHTYLVRVAKEYPDSLQARPLQTGGPYSLRLAFAAGPGPALDVVASPSGTDTVSVSWAAPLSSAGSLPVTGYDVSLTRVEANATPTVQHLDASATSTSFSGLTLGYYTATVTTASSAGAGLPVVVSTGLIAVPGPPALVVSSDAPGEVTASWNAPPPAPYTDLPDSYLASIVDSAPGAVPLTRTFSTSDALTTTFAGLVSGHSYDVTVVAVANGRDGVPATQRITLESAGGTGPRAGIPTTIVRRGDRSITALWSPPAYTGTSGITAYRVRVFLGTSSTLVTSALVSGSRRSAVLGGLVNGRAYSVDVAAVNASGAGLVHRSTLVTPATRPSAPVLGRATSGARGGTTTASVTWSPPRLTGGLAIRGYVVTAWRYDRAGHLVGTRTSSLRPAAARHAVWTLPLGWYRFSVRAVNALGAGATTPRSALVVSR